VKSLETIPCGLGQWKQLIKRVPVAFFGSARHDLAVGSLSRPAARLTQQFAGVLV
jgi:hypothetical protein